MNMACDLLLINPNTPGSYRKAKTITANLGIGSLASYLESKNFKVEILDARYEALTVDQSVRAIRGKDYKIIGISLGAHQNLDWSAPFAKILKEKMPNAHLTLGSYFASLFPEKALLSIPQADSVIIGEGEITLCELMENISGNWKQIDGIAFKQKNEIKINKRRKLISNLDLLPWPRRYLAEGRESDKFEVLMEGSRGCCFFCAFCAVRPFYGLSEGKPWRARSAVNIANEIKFLKVSYKNLKSFRFIDPDFIGTGERAAEFAEIAIKEIPGLEFHMDCRASSIIRNVETLKLLKKAGLVRVYIGIESGSNKILKQMNKLTTVEENEKAINVLKNIGIDYTYGFMMVTPWTNENDIEENISFLKKIGRIEIRNLFHEMTLIPGTPAFNSLKNEGIMKWEGRIGYYTYPALSEKIDKLRKIRSVLENEQNIFMEDLWFIYEGIRYLFQQNRADANELSTKSDNLFFNIFTFCWDKAASVDNESFIAKMCVKTFLPEARNLLAKIEPTLKYPRPLDAFVPGSALFQT